MGTHKKEKQFSCKHIKIILDSIGKQVANKPFYANNSLATHISNEVRIQNMTMSKTHDVINQIYKNN